MLLKLTEKRGLDRTGVLAVNYVVALIMALGLGGGMPRGLDAPAVMIAVVTGALFLAGYLAFGAAIRGAGVGLATGVMRLSVVVPVMGSWLLFSEVPTAGQGAGLVLAGCAFFLLASPSGAEADKRAGRLSGMALLALLFLISGVVDLAVKSFVQSNGPSVGHPAFLAIVFAVASGLAGALIVATRVRSGSWPGSGVLGVGLVLGIVNFGSAAFIMRAAALLPAPLVFPTNAIAIMVGAAILAVTFWGERFSRPNVVGIVLAAVALALLWGGREGGA